MKKRFSLLFICLFTVVFMAGCGSSKPVAATPIPGWEKFEGRGMEIWLPESFEGGNLDENIDSIVTSIRSLGAEYEQTADFIEQNPETFALWVYVPEVGPSGALTNMNVTSQEIPATISIEDYIDAVQTQLPSEFSVVDRSIVDLSNYKVGRVLIDVSNPDVVAKEVLYIVKDGTTVWALTYTTGPSEFEDSLTDFEQSAATFLIVK